jgi:glycerophosphoryl diester phosphodiesterase
MAAIDWITERPIAHRGLHNTTDAPENSLAAFRKAMAANRPIELDVQLGAGDQALVFHDSSFRRMTGADREVRAATAEEVAALRLMGTAECVPTLAETLALVKGRVPLLIELKNEAGAGRLEEQIAAALVGYDGAFAVQSFNPYSLGWFVRNAAHIPRGQLSGDFSDRPDLGLLKRYALKNLLLNFISRPHFVGYDIRAGDESSLRKLKARLAVPLVLWTVRSPEQRDLCNRIGVNFIYEGLDL